MSWDIRNEIMEAAKIVNASITELPLTESKKIKEAVKSRFHDKTFTDENDFAVYNPEAWSWVGDFAKNSKIFLFFSEDNEAAMFEFSDGSQVVPVLGESFGFEFYLTNDIVDYLLFFNHHDYLIAYGTAVDWLKSKAKLDN